MSLETQGTISAWADATFGEPSSNARIAIRALEEAVELVKHLSEDDQHEKAAEEVADIFICLYRVAERLGVDINTEVDRKMLINRGREWKLTGDGVGYHVRKPANGQSAG